MDSHKELVDVLLLSHYNVYERYPGLVERVDYFLHEWSERLLARTESLLRRQSRSLRNMSAKTSSVEDESFTHSRSLNVVWRQWAVCRLQLPRYPPENINWNKDADPVFLYGQTPVVRLEVPWSEHSLAVGHRAPINPSLKPALKRTDLQTFLTSPTLSPAASPPYSPPFSPALSVRESMSTSSLTSDSTLENETLKPRLRFNNKVEQCMVVFNQEKEYLPTDYEDNADDCDDDGFEKDDTSTASHARRPRHTGSKLRGGRGRHTLVIKLAPTHLKGDHRNIAATASSRLVSPPFGSHGSRYTSSEYTSDDDDDDAFYYGYDYDAFYDDEEDPFADSHTSLGRRSNAVEYTAGRLAKRPASNSLASGVSGYVQDYVQSVAGQVRKLVSDAVSVSSFASEKPAKSQRHQKQGHQTAGPEHVVSDPFASCQRNCATGAPAGCSTTKTCTNDSSIAQTTGQPTPCATPSASAQSSSDVVRDPFASALRLPLPAINKVSADHAPFDDDEDAIIQEFERDMQKYTPSASGNNENFHRNQHWHHLSAEHRYPHSTAYRAGVSSADQKSDYDWDDSTYDMYGAEFSIQKVMDDDDENDNEFGFGHDGGNDYSPRFDYSAYKGVPSTFNAPLSSTRQSRYGSEIQQFSPSAVVKDPFSSSSSTRVSSSDKNLHASEHNASLLQTSQQQQQHARVRNESIIDRAEDTIVNTVDAVKWCASFISNYTIF
ncbi:hypothetical protein IWW48_002217 [Coemansia sp. RSA 1200]|nr:hypothetical protein IWW48_002217 [Coemansia sp. RSA 1200]